MRKFVAILCVLTSAGCLSASSPPSADGSGKALVHDLRELEDVATHITVPARFAVLSKEQLDWFWASIASPDVPRPQIDLSREFLVAVFAGRSDSACHDIAISHVTTADDATRIMVERVAPTSTDICARVAPAPFQMVVVSGRPADVIVFEDRLTAGVRGD